MYGWCAGLIVVAQVGAEQSLLETYAEHMRVALPLTPPPPARNPSNVTVAAYAAFSRSQRRRYRPHHSTASNVQNHA